MRAGAWWRWVMSALSSGLSQLVRDYAHNCNFPVTEPVEQNECQMSTTFSHICPYLNTPPVILSSPLILISHWSELIHIPCSHWSDDRKSQKNQHFRKDFWLLMLIYERWTELNQRIMFGRRKSDRLPCRIDPIIPFPTF